MLQLGICRVHHLVACPFCGWVFSTFFCIFDSAVWWLQVLVWLGIFWHFRTSVSDNPVRSIPRQVCGVILQGNHTVDSRSNGWPSSAALCIQQRKSAFILITMISSAWFAFPKSASVCPLWFAASPHSKSPSLRDDDDTSSEIVRVEAQAEEEEQKRKTAIGRLVKTIRAFDVSFIPAKRKFVLFCGVKWKREKCVYYIHLEINGCCTSCHCSAWYNRSFESKSSGKCRPPIPQDLTDLNWKSTERHERELMSVHLDVSRRKKSLKMIPSCFWPNHHGGTVHVAVSWVLVQRPQKSRVVIHCENPHAEVSSFLPGGQIRARHLRDTSPFGCVSFMVGYFQEFLTLI